MANDQLSITYGPIEAGSGHRGMPMIFTNVGQSVLTLSGYPEVTAMNASDDAVGKAKQRLSGYLGGIRDGAELPIVELLPGQSASSMLEALAFDPSDGSATTPYASMQVAPPGESQTQPLEWECDGGTDLYVHPIVPGETGQQL